MSRKVDSGIEPYAGQGTKKWALSVLQNLERVRQAEYENAEDERCRRF